MRRNAKSITSLPFKLCSFQWRQTTDIVSERMHIDSHLFLSAIAITAYSPVSTLYSLTCKISGRIGEKSHFNKFIKIPLHKHEHDTEYRVDMNKHVDSITYSMWAAVCVCESCRAYCPHIHEYLWHGRNEIDRSVSFACVNWKSTYQMLKSRC